jgi:hypothetical protein
MGSWESRVISSARSHKVASCNVINSKTAAVGLRIYDVTTCDLMTIFSDGLIFVLVVVLVLVL